MCSCRVGAYIGVDKEGHELRECPMCGKITRKEKK